MPLGLEPQALTHLLKGGFHLPALHKPSNDSLRPGAELGAQQGLCLELFSRIADQHPAQRHGGKSRAVQSAVPEAISTVRSSAPYQLVTVVGSQVVAGSSAIIERF